MYHRTAFTSLAMFLPQRVMVTVPYKMPVRISKDEVPGEVPVPLVTTHPILKITSHFLIINHPHWKLLQNKKTENYKTLAF